jgi:hypothetical protein
VRHRDDALPPALLQLRAHAGDDGVQAVLEDRVGIAHGAGCGEEIRVLRYVRARRLLLDNTRAQVALMQPGPHTEALRGIFGKLVEHDDANRWLSDMMGGTDVRYEVGSELDVVGRFCPDLELETADGVDAAGGAVRLAERQRSGRGQLLVLDAAESQEAAQWIKTASEWGDRVEVTVGTCAEAPSRAVLVRPDGFVAWVAESEQGLEEALGCWFGPADPTAM